MAMEDRLQVACAAFSFYMPDTCLQGIHAPACGFPELTGFLDAD
jgi:hypothetical protein